MLVTVAPSAASGRGLRSLEGTALGDLLQRFDQAQTEVETLEAEFREVRESGLFADPLILSGRLLMRRPDRILWIYREPEPRYFLLEGRTLTAWYPEQGVAERQDLKRYSRRLRRMVGIDQSAEDLVRNNEVHLLARSELPEARELLLIPRNRRLREYLPEVRLWVDQATALPVQVRYREASGDQVTLSLENPQRNIPLTEETWQLPIPEGTEVRRKLSSMGPFGGED
jgi:outer membrane lipoprotein-sorting protein